MKNLGLASFALALALTLPACGSSSDSDGAGGKGGSGGSSWDPAHPASCGLADYTWLPADQVGGVLEQKLAQEVTVAELKALATLLAATTAKVARPPTYDVSLYVVRYQTQDKGKLIDATTMVAIPKVSTSTNFPILEFLHGTTGFDDSCAPSKNATDRSKPFTALALLSASMGYVSVFPDYIGLKSLGGTSSELLPYLIAEPTAFASLDAIRAAKQFVADQATSITLGDVVIEGHSQGGHATEVTTRLAPYYAPELSIVGAAYLAAPTNMSGSFQQALAGNSSSTGIALGVSYLYTNQLWYGGPAMSEVLLPPWDSKADSVVRNVCDPSYTHPLDGVTDIAQVFQPALLDALAQGGGGFDPWSCYLSANNPVDMPEPVDTKIPALYVLGEKDTLVVPEPQRTAFESLCERGAKLVYLECSGADHGQTLAYSLDDQLDFFEARLKGDPLPATACQLAPATKCKSMP